MKPSSTPGWTIVGEFDTLPDASIIAGAIENEGIPTTILNSSLQSTLPLTFTWAPVQLLVPEEMAETASEFVPDGNRV
ncbi:MAG: DUF2007 domain-containing protein [Muribaculaceae bacterium]|nr:DUF2007 domain-containing protein [Muribaculaceae bacterium]